MGLSERVQELRIGGLQAWARMELLSTFDFNDVQLPHCSTLVLDWQYLPLHRSPQALTSPLDRFVASLPVNHLTVYVARWKDSWSDPEAYELLQTGLPLAGQPWGDLRSIRMRGDKLWCHRRGSEPMRLAFSDWGSKTLSIDVPKIVTDATWLHRAFLDPVELVESDHWWAGLEKIEVQTSAEVETEFRRRLAEAKKAGPLARLQTRILPMVVFVDEDGTERRLTEDEDISV